MICAGSCHARRQNISPAAKAAAARLVENGEKAVVRDGLPQSEPESGGVLINSLIGRSPQARALFCPQARGAGSRTSQAWLIGLFVHLSLLRAGLLSC